MTMAAVHPLISLDELMRLAAAPVLLDVRWQFRGPPGIDAYLAGHLPGAVFVDLDRDLCGQPGPHGRRPIPDPDTFTAAMRRLGVATARPVVVYDAGDGTAAARGWWLLRYFGHPHARLLDGGLTAWTAAGQPLEKGAATASEGDFTATPGHLPTVDADEAAQLAREGTLLDARPATRYRGERNAEGETPGHIPGAVSAPAHDCLDRHGRFLPAAVLRERFTALGLTPGRPAGAYCGSGILATHTVLAAAVAGYDAALYPGSWGHWTSDTNRPTTTGPQPG